MSQSKKGSALETVTSTATGFILTWFASYLIYPLIGVEMSHSQNFAAVILFTILSLARGYVLRRIFNWITVRQRY